MKDFETYQEFCDYTNDIQVMVTIASSEEEARERFISRVEAGTHTVTFESGEPYLSESFIYTGPIHDMNCTYSSGMCKIDPYKKVIINLLKRAEIKKIDEDTILISADY